MNSKPHVREVLFLSIMGTLFVPALALLFPSQVPNAVVALLAGAVIGWLAGTAKDLLSPAPNPDVPLEIVDALIRHLGGMAPAGLIASGPPMFRPTVLCIGFMGCALVFGLALALGDGASAEIICGLAGTLLGAFASCMKDLINPPPGAAVPASVVEKILATLKLPAAAAAAGGERTGLEAQT